MLLQWTRTMHYQLVPIPAGISLWLWSMAGGIDRVAAAAMVLYTYLRVRFHIIDIARMKKLHLHFSHAWFLNYRVYIWK